MTKLAVVIMIVAFTGLWLMGGAQNLIYNGTDWTDSNSDGLADGWVKSVNTNYVNADSGYQYVYSTGSVCAQSSIWQNLTISNTTPKRYQVTVTAESNTEIWVIAKITPTIGMMIMIIPPTDMATHTAVFDQSASLLWDIVGLQFCCPGGGTNWLKIDDVSMVELDPVGIEELEAKHKQDNRIFDMLGRQLSRIPEGTPYIQNRTIYCKNCR